MIENANVNKVFFMTPTVESMASFLASHTCTAYLYSSNKNLINEFCFNKIKLFVEQKFKTKTINLNFTKNPLS